MSQQTDPYGNGRRRRDAGGFETLDDYGAPGTPAPGTINYTPPSDARHYGQPISSDWIELENGTFINYRTGERRPAQRYARGGQVPAAPPRRAAPPPPPARKPAPAAAAKPAPRPAAKPASRPAAAPARPAARSAAPARPAARPAARPSSGGGRRK